MKRLLLVFMLGLTLAPLAGCVVAPVPVRPACAWVPGHYNFYGQWVPGHCRY